MKKLFLFAALIMTGFAFYSCEDVVDNPAKDPAQSWNYSVSVKFDAFDFTNQATDPVTGEDNVYKVPTTLYVLNEENTLMGTITTDAAPTAGNYGTYAGTLTGTIGNNLIITTKIGNDLGKQDGTLKSAIENGIVQTAEVPIKIYNANSGTLTTASAKMENTATIAHIASWQIKGGDKITFVADDQPFEWTVYEEFNTPATSQDLYIAIPTSADPEAEYTISTDSKDGYTRGLTLKLADYPSLAKGKVSIYLGYPQFIETGVDLTKYDAYKRDNATDKTTGYYTLYQKINDDKSFIITQSGGKLDSMSVYVYGNADKSVALTIDNINLGEGRYFGINNGAKFDINLIGENKFETLNLNTPFTKKGTGTWSFKRLNIGGSYSGYDTDGNLIVNYAAEYTIEEDLNLTYLTLNSGAKLTIADGKKLNVATKENWTAIEVQNSILNIGKGATLEASNSRKDQYAVYTYNSKINIGENATFKALGGKNNKAMYLKADNKFKYELNIGKNATVELIGGPSGTLGRGAEFVCNNADAILSVNLDEGASLTAIGIDNYGMWLDPNSSGVLNFNIAKNTKVVAEDTGDANYSAIYADVDDGKLNITGEGAFEAKSNAGSGMELYRWGGEINFKGGNITAIGGTNMPAIKVNNSSSTFKPFTIAPEIKKFTATTGMTSSPLYIALNDEEVKIDDLVADKTKFNDATADGARTITPKPAAE
ncbi:MAG: hypothetical protein J6M36_08385 [Prevotella sp.]|nr:hypothetical protein [Prevotella sp.]